MSGITGGGDSLPTPLLEVRRSIQSTMNSFSVKIDDVYRDSPKYQYFRRFTLILKDLLTAMLNTASLCELLAEKRMIVRYDYHLIFSINGPDMMRDFVVVEGRHPAFEPDHPDLTVRVSENAREGSNVTRGFSKTEIVELIDFIAAEISSFGGQ